MNSTQITKAVSFALICIGLTFLLKELVQSYPQKAISIQIGYIALIVGSFFFLFRRKFKL